jgi:uncharacterized membrane protein YcaP (DUF421 family)
MNLVLRAAIVYVFLWAVIRMAGRRTLADSSPFDLVLLLIIGEAVNNALIPKDDHSLTSAIVVVLTLVSIEVGMSLWRARSTRGEKILDGVPLLLAAHGEVLATHLATSRVTLSDLEAAIRQQGLRSLEEVDFIVLEASGRLSVIPARKL